MRVRIFPGFLLPMIGMLFFALCSCNNQFYRGYGYKGSTGAPDIHPERLIGNASESPISVATVAAPAEYQETPKPMNPRPAGTGTIGSATASQHSMTSDHIEETALQDAKTSMGTLAGNAEIHALALDEAGRLAEEGKAVNHQNLARNLGQRLTDEGIIKALTPGQERKMNRLAAKMDKKAQKQGKEIDWKNNTGLELFFMIMAIGGLVLGIVGVGIGWFVFIVFAGLWLYFKLAKD